VDACEDEDVDEDVDARHDVAAGAATDASLLRWKLLRPPPAGVIDKTRVNSGYPQPRRPFAAVGACS